MVRGWLSEDSGAGNEGNVQGGRCWRGKCPTEPEKNNLAVPGLGREEQGGDAAHSRGQSRAQEQCPAAGLDTTDPSPAPVTPVLFSYSPGWPGGALPPIPQRPSSKPGESPPGHPCTAGTPGVPEEGGGGHPHTLPVPQPCPHSCLARGLGWPIPGTAQPHTCRCVRCPGCWGVLWWLRGVPLEDWESWLVSPSALMPLPPPCLPTEVNDPPVCPYSETIFGHVASPREPKVRVWNPKTWEF